MFQTLPVQRFTKKKKFFVIFSILFDHISHYFCSIKKKRSQTNFSVTSCSFFFYEKKFPFFDHLFHHFFYWKSGPQKILQPLPVRFFSRKKIKKRNRKKQTKAASRSVPILEEVKISSWILRSRSRLSVVSDTVGGGSRSSGVSTLGVYTAY